MSRFSISLLVENAITEYIDTIGNLRTDILKDFSYLYQFNNSLEDVYLQKYTIAKDSIAVILKDQDSVVGVLIGLPLRYENDTLKTPWIAHNFDTNKVYYFSEILLEEKYRTNTFIQELYATAQDWICSFQKYDYFTFVEPNKSVQELQPDNKFWIDNGYISFNDVMPSLLESNEGQTKESEELNFLIKKIEY